MEAALSRVHQASSVGVGWATASRQHPQQTRRQGRSKSADFVDDMNGNPFAMPLVFGLDQQRVPLGELTAMHGQILQMNAKIEDLTRKLDSEKKKKSIGLVGSITMVIKVQAAWRRKAQLREYCIMLLKVRPAVIKLQTAARRMVAVLAYRKRCAVAIPAVIMLQAASRRMNKLRSYLKQSQVYLIPRATSMIEWRQV